MSVKTATKTKVATNAQIRINRTPVIEKILEMGRQKYKLLDDNEILKIFIGRGAELEQGDSFDYLKSANWNSNSSPQAFTSPDSALEWLGTEDRIAKKSTKKIKTNSTSQTIS